MIPKLDAFMVLKSIRKDKNIEISATPVMMLTNMAHRGHIEQSLLLGANDYVIKTHFTPVEIVQKIKRYI
jgi:CheY-like chemotaxis protein